MSLCILMSVSWKRRPNNVAGSISVTAGTGSKGAFQNKMVRMWFYLLINLLNNLLALCWIAVKHSRSLSCRINAVVVAYLLFWYVPDVYSSNSPTFSRKSCPLSLFFETTIYISVNLFCHFLLNLLLVIVISCFFSLGLVRNLCWTTTYSILPNL